MYQFSFLFLFVLCHQSKPSADIKYNVVNVISAYTFVTRLHNGDHHDCSLECSEVSVAVRVTCKEG